MGRVQKVGDSFVVVADADSIIAQANPYDANHQKANIVSQKLISINARVLYPVSAISEAITVLQTKLNSLPTAMGTASVFCESRYEVTNVDQDLFSYANEKYFKFVKNKKDTIFDCLVAATADKYNVDIIFSFDKFYKDCGFKLAGELV